MLARPIPPFLPEVKQDSAAGGADQPQRLPELRAAIAFQRPEHVSGQALAVQPDQRRRPAEGADDQGDMVLAVVTGAEGGDLRFRHILKRQAGAGNQADVG